MRNFEFHAYQGDEHGVIAERAEITANQFDEKSQAISYGGRMAKRINGPVDIAFNDQRPWADRYITTASPSEHHTTGFRTERLDG